jgi:hypothetical protein
MAYQIGTRNDVLDPIKGGKKFLDEFETYVPVRAAFGLNAGEDSGCYRYAASDEINEKSGSCPGRSRTRLLIRSQ